MRGLGNRRRGSIALNRWASLALLIEAIFQQEIEIIAPIGSALI